MHANSPIGVFDSGLGGLSVVDEIRRQMPCEDIIFFGDSANNPYGTKTREEILSFSRKIMDYFVEKDVKAVVIACNTATSAAADDLRSEYDFDIVGMEPALKVAALEKTPSTIAVWATPFTLREKKFQKLMNRFKKEHTILSVPCPKLVTCIEENRLEDKKYVDQLLLECLERSGDKLPDAIVLGCTHFIYYRDALEKLTEGKCSIIDGNSGTARHLQDLLKQKNLCADPSKSGRLTIENSLPEKALQSQHLIKILEEANHGK